MSAEIIPVEILVMIFKNLKGRDAIACRAVCRHWRDVVDSLPDEVWERYCCLDFWNPVAANKVSNLGYRELYKSLSLWSKVEKAEVTSKQLPRKLVRQFKILNNNTLVVLNGQTVHWGFRLYNNQVEYYNMENMKLISREHYGFYFKKYDENDKLITMVDTRGRLSVITKSNEKKFVIGEMYDGLFTPNYTLFDTEVYFVNAKEVICVARLKVVNGEETIETEELEEIAEHVIAFAQATEDSVNMLTDEGNIYCYRHSDKDFETCTQIDSWTPHIIYELWEYGFHWSDPKIYEWLDLFDEQQVNITELKSSAIHSHNHVVLIGTTRGTVHIFKRPYKNNGELVLYKARPNRSINMNKYNSANTTDKPNRVCKTNEIQQLGIVEILNGHRIIVLTEDKLFFIDLVHKQSEVNKRSIASTTRAKLSTSSKKKAKTVKRPIQSKIVNITVDNGTSPIEADENENTQKRAKRAKTAKKNKKASNVTKHMYNTRSKDKGV